MKKFILFCFVFIYTFLLASNAQIIQLVKEINPSGASNPRNFTVCNNKLFFIAQKDNSGIPSLWVTTGTDAKTQLLYTGLGNSFSALTSYNNKLYFAYDDGIHGTELWTSDGTVAGTVLFKDINPGVAASFPEALIINNGKLFFDAVGSNGLYNLYVSDGTDPGTALIRNGILLVGGHGGIHPILGTNIYFDSDNGTGTGNGLWKTDGTTTALVKGDIIASEVPGMYAVMNNKLYLNVGEATTGTELWVTDGTTAGTNIVKNLRADGGGVFSSGNPKAMTVYNGKLYFSGSDDTHGEELFVTDGTEVGTHLVKDILVGPNGSLPRASIVYNSLLYFSTTNTNELWKTDGTEVGTVLVKNTLVPVQFAAIWNGKMYLADGQNIIHLQESNGTTAGTKDAVVQNVSYPIDPLYNINDPNQAFNFTEYKSDLYFAGRCFTITGGYEPVRLTLGQSGPLPLNLLSFTGEVKQNNDLLKWTTANEINTDYFIVEQSSDGSVFKAGAKIKASGTTPGNKSYSFSQSSLLNTGGFYRLKMVDINEAFTYSPVLKLKRDNDRFITAMYNSATKQIRLNNYTNINYKWQLASLGGSILNNGTAQQGLTAINSSSLAKGTYVVICTANNISQNFKLVIY